MLYKIQGISGTNEIFPLRCSNIPHEITSIVITRWQKSKKVQLFLCLLTLLMVPRYKYICTSIKNEQVFCPLRSARSNYTFVQAHTHATNISNSDISNSSTKVLRQKKLYFYCFYRCIYKLIAQQNFTTTHLRYLSHLPRLTQKQNNQICSSYSQNTKCK